MNASALDQFGRFGRFPLYISTPIAAVVAGIAHWIIGDLLNGVPDGFQVDAFSGEQDLAFGSSMFATFLYVYVLTAASSTRSSAAPATTTGSSSSSP